MLKSRPIVIKVDRTPPSFSTKYAKYASNQSRHALVTCSSITPYSLAPKTVNTIHSPFAGPVRETTFYIEMVESTANSLSYEKHTNDVDVVAVDEANDDARCTETDPMSEPSKEGTVTFEVLKSDAGTVHPKLLVCLYLYYDQSKDQRHR